MKLRRQPKQPLKKWTEDGALRATHVRYDRIKVLLTEIALLWGDVDMAIIGRAEELMAAVDDAKLDATLNAQCRAEERED